MSGLTGSLTAGGGAGLKADKVYVPGKTVWTDHELYGAVPVVGLSGVRRVSFADWGAASGGGALVFGDGSRIRAREETAWDDGWGEDITRVYLEYLGAGGGLIDTVGVFNGWDGGFEFLKSPFDLGGAKAVVSVPGDDGGIWNDEVRLGTAVEEPGVWLNLGDVTPLILRPKMVWVEKWGSDATGCVGNPARPFATPQAAWDAVAALTGSGGPLGGGYTFFVGQGRFEAFSINAGAMGVALAIYGASPQMNDSWRDADRNGGTFIGRTDGLGLTVNGVVPGVGTVEIRGNRELIIAESRFPGCSKVLVDGITLDKSNLSTNTAAKFFFKDCRGYQLRADNALAAVTLLRCDYGVLSLAPVVTPRLYQTAYGSISAATGWNAAGNYQYTTPF